MKGIYQVHGDLCVSHPWEVIVATIALIACIFSIDASKFIPFSSTYQSSSIKDPSDIDVFIMASIRFAAIVYCFFQFCHLQRMESKYIGIAAIFTAISSLIFFSSVISYFSAEYSDLNLCLRDGLCFFILLIDLPKASGLAQFAFSAALKSDIKENISRGISTIGPSVTLDTVVKVLMLSTGTLLGIQKLEILCNFARISVVVNYVVFMTFYPSTLSLILELTKHGQCMGVLPNHQNTRVKEKYLQEILKSNPVLQRLKLIMSMGILMVHFICQWSEREVSVPTGSLAFIEEKPRFEDSNYTSPVTELSWVTLTTDNIVCLFLLFALAVKFVFFEEDGPSIFSSSADDKSLKKVAESQEKITQTDDFITAEILDTYPDNNYNKYAASDRTLNECIELYKEALGHALNDEEVELLVKKNVIQTYQLEKAVNDSERGVRLRRKILGSGQGFRNVFDDIPYKGYDYSKVLGACCENILGYIPIPLGIAGPLKLDNEMIMVPLATTEGCLVASTNRGCRALLENGITSRVVGDGMTRGPVVRFNSVSRASEAMLWIKRADNFIKIKESFDSTSRYARLMNIHIRIAGRYLFIRFVATTGDAMGMNMVSKGTEVALHFVHETFPDMEVISLSGNFCSDKKPAAVNWIEGRGKYVVCEAIVPHNMVKTILKTTVNALVDVNINKNLVGSAMAGSIGGCNAHAANIVTAIYIATGQDPAQNVGSSNCITLMEPWGQNGQDLYISCTMPSIEIGTVGGGTQLNAQAACLDMLGVKGANEDIPGENANKLARIVCGSVLAGELSLLSALAAGHLVKSHLRHNRSSTEVKDLTRYFAENVFSTC